MKKPLNHQKNLTIGIIVSLAFAIIVSAVNPSNGWVAGLMTILLAVLPMFVIKAIISAWQSSGNQSDTDAGSVVAEQSGSTVTDEHVIERTAESEFKFRGWVHLVLGSVILVFSIVQLVAAQSAPLWTKMFAEPFWMIIAMCSVVSFLLAASNFSKAQRNKNESEDK